MPTRAPYSIYHLHNHMTFPSDFLTLPLTQPVVIITLVLVIILCAPILFSRLKIPNIVGLILAGVAVVAVLVGKRELKKLRKQEEKKSGEDQP